MSSARKVGPGGRVPQARPIPTAGPTRPLLPSVLQPKTAAPPQPLRPPACRPQPSAAQRPAPHAPTHVKSAPAAPQVYRPQPTPAALQRKTAVAQAHGAAKSQQPPRAPQVQRPPVIQTRRVPTPHANVPGPKGAVQPKKEFNARGGKPPAAPPVYRPAPPRSTSAPSVQPKPNAQGRPSAPLPPARRPTAPTPGRPAPVVQAKYDVLISTQIPKEKQKDLVIESVTVTDRPAYPDNIQGVYQFGKDNEKGHTVAWNVIKLHHENKYKGKTIAQAAADLNIKKKSEVIGRTVEPTVDGVRWGLKQWIEHKHKLEVVYWDSSGENKGRGGFFGGVRDEYDYYRRQELKKIEKGESLDKKSKDFKKLYQELMVISAVDFQQGDSKKLKRERTDRIKRKLGRVYNDDFSWVTLDNWSGEVDDLKKYKNKRKRQINPPAKRPRAQSVTTTKKRKKK